MAKLRQYIYICLTFLFQSELSLHILVCYNKMKERETCPQAFLQKAIFWKYIKHNWFSRFKDHGPLQIQTKCLYINLCFLCGNMVRRGFRNGDLGLGLSIDPARSCLLCCGKLPFKTWRNLHGSLEYAETTFFVCNVIWKLHIYF